MNEIKHKCQFCKERGFSKAGEVTLSPAKHEHKCACGVIYRYRPNAGKTYVRKPQKIETPPVQ